MSKVLKCQKSFIEGSNVSFFNFSVGGLQCYTCNSHNDSRCAGEKLPESMRKDCATIEPGNKHTMCRKITQVIEFEVNGMPPDSRVIRGCGWDESNYKVTCYVLNIVIRCTLTQFSSDI